MSKAIGIDLGTTFSAIAELDDLGNPEVLTSIDNNSKITASAVYIGKDNNVIVGDKAKDASVAEPKRVIKEVKREMENDVCYDLKKGKWVPAKDESDQSYIPSQISSLILKKLKENTSDVKKVVVTVPALFAEKARSATLDAIKLADMECLELINEPTAAILHYANLPGVSVGGRVLVFDLGGGTFDVTIAKVKDKKVDVITINDEEARQLSGEYSLVKAAQKIHEMGPDFVVIKKGEHGALIFNEGNIFFAPALPLEEVFDPTGAGDTFAGGFCGYLAKTEDISFENMKNAIIYGSNLASFCVEKFGTERMQELTKEEVKNRLQAFKELTQFDIELS